MNIGILFNYLPLLLQGGAVTILLWLIAAGISLSLGTLLGIFNCNKLKKPFVSFTITSYIFVIKGIPIFVQLLLAYFVVPQLIGVNISPAAAATVTLGLCSAAYIAEIVRAGINTITQGQWEACFVLGYTKKQTLWRIILPQMIRNCLPALVGEMDQMVKSTALFATIGVIELTRTAMNIVSRELNPIPIYGFIALVYLCISLIINTIGKRLERRLNYDFS